MSFFDSVFRKIHKKKAKKAVTSGSLTNRFQAIYRERFWSSESVSGPGSTMSQTETLRLALPGLLTSLGVKHLLDAPCGDFHWMQHVEFGSVHYTGGDIVPELVAENQENFGNSQREFKVLDLVKSPLPDADLLMCRDVLVHLSYEHIEAALRNICASNVTWLLTTHFPAHENKDIPSGLWRPINLCAEPFNLPTPQQAVVDTPATEDVKFQDKVMALWLVDDLRKLL
jgi:hypothetical protein